MPIKPENRRRYPSHWREIVAEVRERSDNRCEGSPAYPDCRAANGEPHPVTGSRVVLTVGHLDHTPEHCDLSNLRHWCQRCHLNYDHEHHQRNAYQTRRDGKAVDMFEEREATTDQPGASPCPQCGMTDATMCRRFDCERQWGGLYPNPCATVGGAG